MPLTIVSVEPPKAPPKSTKNPSSKRAHYEKLWLQNPEQFDPTTHARGNARLQSSWDLICQWAEQNGGFEGKMVVDLGCGFGHLGIWCAEKGAQVTALDISSRALTHLRTETLTPMQDSLPCTKLPDAAFDLVICAHTLAELPPKERRLGISECARLVKREGYVLCSTDLDVDSSNAGSTFFKLLLTELLPLKIEQRYHRLFVKWENFLKLPKQRVQLIRSPDTKKTYLKGKYRWTRPLYRLQTVQAALPLWQLLEKVSSPLRNRFKKSTWLLNLLEKISQWIWHEDCATELTVIGKRKPLERSTGLKQSKL